MAHQTRGLRREVQPYRSVMNSAPRVQHWVMPSWNRNQGSFNSSGNRQQSTFKFPNPNNFGKRSTTIGNGATIQGMKYECIFLALGTCARVLSNVNGTESEKSRTESERGGREVKRSEVK